jgi:hypothetical protein
VSSASGYLNCRLDRHSRPCSPEKGPCHLRWSSLPPRCRDWLRSTYNKTTEWLKNGGGPWKVPELFLWNLASWDVVSCGPGS